MRSLFQDGCFDFIQLQKIDFRQGFICEHGCSDLTADGITLGYKAARLFLQRPYAADISVDPVVGSLPIDRLLLPAPALRHALLLYAGDGCAPAVLQQLVAGITALSPTHLGRSLLPFLVPGPKSTVDLSKPPELWRQVLFSIGTAASECQLLPWVVYPAVQELLDQGAMHWQHHILLVERAPVLYKFMKPTLQYKSSNELSNVKSLLRSLMKVWNDAQSCLRFLPFCRIVRINLSNLLNAYFEPVSTGLSGSFCETAHG